MSVHTVHSAVEQAVVAAYLPSNAGALQLNQETAALVETTLKRHNFSLIILLEEVMKNVWED